MKNLALVFLSILLINNIGFSQYVLTPVPLPNHIYHKNDDQFFYPLVSPDGTMLVYMSTNKNMTHYYWINRNGNTWSKPHKIETLKHLDFDFELSGFDGNSLFFYTFSEDQKKFKIYKSDFKNGEFMVPVPFNLKSFTNENAFFHWKLGNPHKMFYADKPFSEKEQTVYETYYNGKQWSIPKPLPNDLAADGMGLIIALGENGVFFEKHKSKNKLNPYYMSFKKNDTWSVPVRLTIKASDTLDISNIHFSSYSEVTKELFFTYNYQKLYSAKLSDNLSELITIDYNSNVTRLINKSSTGQEGLNVRDSKKTKYYALLFAIDDYSINSTSLMDLNNPIHDASLLQKTLIENYTFTEETITLLRNPKRSEIINAFEKIAEVISEKDNLLIFYAGHGIWDDKLNIGYWLSSDATSENKSNWISNSTIKDYIAGLNTRHTLLISDACFSGSIFKTREITNTIDDFGFYRLSKLPSRKAMTSGTLKTVPDNSMFMKYLLKSLNQNEQDFLPSRELFQNIYTATINNTSNIPQFGTIQNTGDEGGDFIFIKK